MTTKNMITASLVLLVIALSGCATPLPEPSRPTDCEKVCVDNCLTLRNCCVKSCNWIIERDQPDCRNDCTRELEDCYKKCEQEAQDE